MNEEPPLRLRLLQLFFCFIEIFYVVPTWTKLSQELFLLLLEIDLFFSKFVILFVGIKISFLAPITKQSQSCLISIPSLESPVYRCPACFFIVKCFVPNDCPFKPRNLTKIINDIFKNREEFTHAMLELPFPMKKKFGPSHVYRHRRIFVTHSHDM